MVGTIRERHGHDILENTGDNIEDDIGMMRRFRQFRQFEVC